MILRYLIAIAVCAMATTATAQDRGAVSAGLGVTSFGYTLEGAYQLRPTLGLRGMIMGGFSIDDTFDYEGTSVNGTADLGGVAVVADYYPLANAWRMSGGLFFSNSDVSGSFTEGAVTYDGKLVFENDVAPMVTTGFRIGMGAVGRYRRDRVVAAGIVQQHHPDRADRCPRHQRGSGRCAGVSLCRFRCQLCVLTPQAQRPRCCTGVLDYL